ncbi:MAG: TIGR03032 family protein [Planctomycetaceae bacterium]|nr:TIGR03032 family protein [Planctomycetaceae bacterium]
MAGQFEITCSRGFPDWLASQQVSLGVTTYQGNRLLLLGLKPDGRLAVFQRVFERCMGLYAVSRPEEPPSQTLWMTSKCQVWRFENMLVPGQHFDGCDRSFAPQQVFYTGDVDAHDIAVESTGRVLFVSTLLSCVATLSERFSLQPVWRPPFVSKLAAEDRCHLNGLALEHGRMKYVTACAKADSFDGWRDHRDTGGCVLDVESGETILTGLSMPHSPRVYRDKLWVLNSGAGEFGYVDREVGRLECVAECSGYARGLAFVNGWALVGTSLPRHEPTFRGLPIEQKFSATGQTPRCGLQVISLETGDTAHWVRIEGDVQELYDVVVLPEVVRPRAAGIQNDEVHHNIWFQDETGEHRSWTAAPKSRP